MCREWYKVMSKSTPTIKIMGLTTSFQIFFPPDINRVALLIPPAGTASITLQFGDVSNPDGVIYVSSSNVLPYYDFFALGNLLTRQISAKGSGAVASYPGMTSISALPQDLQRYLDGS